MSSIDKKPKFEPDPPPDFTGLSFDDAFAEYKRWTQAQHDRMADWWPRETESRLDRIEQFVPLVGTWPIVDYSYVLVTLSELFVCDPNTLTLTDAYDHSVETSGFPWSQISISQDGLHLYTGKGGTGGPGRGLAQYTMSTAFDLTTISYVTFLALTDFIFGVEIKTDGTQIYTLDGNTNILRDYDLSTPFDLSTIVTPANNAVTLSAFSQAQGLAISENGVHMYTGRNISNSHSISYWVLGTPWDISTAVFQYQIDTRTIPNWPVGTNWRCICCDISRDGKTMVVNGITSGVLILDFSTPYDLSSVSYTRETTPAGGAGATEGIAISNNCEKLYISSPADNEFREFEIS